MNKFGTPAPLTEVEQKRRLLRSKLPRGSKVYTVRMPGSSRHRKYILLCSFEGRVENITIPARIACELPAYEVWTKGGTGYNHARDCVEALALALYQDVNALDWESLT